MRSWVCGRYDQAVVDFVDISIVEARLVINPQDIAAEDLSIDPVD